MLEILEYLLILIGLGAFISACIYKYRQSRRRTAKKAKATTTSTTTTSTTTHPTPTPATSPRKYGWGWLVIAILVAIIAYHFIAPMMRTTAPAPQATAPKKELHKYTVRRPLEFLGGENFTRGSNYIGILKGGYANFRVNLPVVKNGKYKIYYHGRRVREGRDLLEINRGKGNSGMPFGIDHRATDIPIELVFYDSGYDIGMPGDAKYFRTGDNFLKLWADDDLLVQMDQPPYVEITYWE